MNPTIKQLEAEQAEEAKRLAKEQYEKFLKETRRDHDRARLKKWRIPWIGLGSILLLTTAIADTYVYDLRGNQIGYSALPVGMRLVVVMPWWEKSTHAVKRHTPSVSHFVTHAAPGGASCDMNTSTDGSEAAYSFTPTEPGFTRRERAAIDLRIPDSGLPWLDEMIRRAKQNDGELPCCHEWYQGRCVHCEIAVKDYRAAKESK